MLLTTTAEINRYPFVDKIIHVKNELEMGLLNTTVITHKLSDTVLITGKTQTF